MSDEAISHLVSDAFDDLESIARSGSGSAMSHTRRAAVKQLLIVDLEALMAQRAEEAVQSAMASAEAERWS
jgi:hypothetical protein